MCEVIPHMVNTFMYACVWSCEYHVTGIHSQFSSLGSNVQQAVRRLKGHSGRTAREAMVGSLEGRERGRGRGRGRGRRREGRRMKSGEMRGVEGRTYTRTCVGYLFNPLPQFSRLSIPVFL